MIGGVIGLFAGGPIGALVGGLLGHQFDHAADGSDELAPQLPPAEVAQRFFAATFEIMGYVAKADGRVSEAEIAAASAIMEQLKLDDASRRAAIECFGRGKAPGFALGDAVASLQRACRGRADLRRIFMEIQLRAALGGSDMAGPARQILQRIGASLGVSALELAHLEAVLRIRGSTAGAEPSSAAARQGALRDAYEVLEINDTATDPEVAKAYRRQLSRHHPDKLKANGLPESMLEHAKERTRQIIEAYDLIRKTRGTG